MTGDARDGLHARVAPAILIGALTFNAALCLANTVLFPISDVMVMGAELVLIAAAMGFGLDRRAGPYLILAVFLSYAALLMAMRPGLDPKAVRDFLIPIAFYLMGRRRPDPTLADRAAFLSGLIVVAFGLFEYLAFDTFERYFNIIRYYVARGTVAPSEMAGQTGTLFVSGTRPDARNILPFLGPHRVSSVFLEPVSAGNFGAILYIWALHRPAMRWRWTTLACGLATIVLSDARFGLYTAVAATPVLLLANRLPRLPWLVLPFGMMAGLAIYGFESAQVDWQNNLAGRLLWTARLITSLDVTAAFGLSPDKPFLSDSGYAYSLNEIGLVGLVGFWALFCLLPLRNPAAWRFKACAGLYICLLLLISDSPYSIKTAALLWFMLGTSDGAPIAAGRRPVGRPVAAFPARVLQPAAAAGAG